MFCNMGRLQRVFSNMGSLQILMLFLLIISVTAETTSTSTSNSIITENVTLMSSESHSTEMTTLTTVDANSTSSDNVTFTDIATSTPSGLITTGMTSSTAATTPSTDITTPSTAATTPSTGTLTSTTAKTSSTTEDIVTTTTAVMATTTAATSPTTGTSTSATATTSSLTADIVTTTTAGTATSTTATTSSTTTAGIVTTTTAGMTSTAETTLSTEKMTSTIATTSSTSADNIATTTGGTEKSATPTTTADRTSTSATTLSTEPMTSTTAEPSSTTAEMVTITTGRIMTSTAETTPSTITSTSAIDTTSSTTADVVTTTAGGTTTSTAATTTSTITTTSATDTTSSTSADIVTATTAGVTPATTPSTGTLTSTTATTTSSTTEDIVTTTTAVMTTTTAVTTPSTGTSTSATATTSSTTADIVTTTTAGIATSTTTSSTTTADIVTTTTAEMTSTAETTLSTELMTSTTAEPSSTAEMVTITTGGIMTSTAETTPSTITTTSATDTTSSTTADIVTTTTTTAGTGTSATITSSTTTADSITPTAAGTTTSTAATTLSTELMTSTTATTSSSTADIVTTSTAGTGTSATATTSSTTTADSITATTSEMTSTAAATISTEITMSTTATTNSTTADSLTDQTTGTTTSTSTTPTVAGCSGTVDCAGDCDGQAVLHSTCNVCYGGNANYSVIGDFVDCNNVCFGSATTNKCGECYGGTTGRTQTYGVDSCNGQCTERPGYVNTTDCNNVCNGTAVIGACDGECVGGDTGRTAADFRDCNNNCKGDTAMIIDECGFCVVATSTGSTGSQYKDCNGDCYTPGTISEMATVNECNVCVGGNTTKPLTAGKDLCGVCGGDNSTCLDCDGVPNGGKVNDACGVCDGTGTSCLSVTSLSPDYVPSGVSKTVTAVGAGFDTSTVECVLVNQDTNSKTDVSKAAQNAKEMTVTVPSTVSEGTYKLHCRQGPGEDLSNSTALLTVYAASGATVIRVTPTSFITSGSTETLQISGTGFVNNHTFCHLKVGSETEVVSMAKVSNSENATCDVSHPGTSSEIQMSLSLNKQDKLGSVFTITANAAAPTVTAAFTNPGDKVIVTFSTAIATASLTSCSAVFQEVTSLGPDAACSFSSRSVMFIASTTAAIGAVLNLKSQAVKTFGESFAIAASGAVTLVRGDNPVSPVGVVRGSKQIGSCSELKVDAYGSTGGGGRELNYTWSVSPSAGLTLDGVNTAELTTTGTSGGTTYTVSIEVCNFMGVCDNTATLTVQKLSTAIPDVYVTSNTDVKNVKPSQSFKLEANARLNDCVDDTLLFDWTFDDTRVTVNRANTRVYNVKAGDLPAGVTVTATVTVSLASTPTTKVQASISLETKSGDLVSVIKGGNLVTIGTTSGQLVLDGSDSNDPDGAPGSLTYDWSCVKVMQGSADSSCLDRNGEGIPASSERQSATLSVTSTLLLPTGNSMYKFTLTVSKVSGNTMRRATSDVRVMVVDGTPPKVSFGESYNNGKLSVEDVVTLTATIEAATTVTYKWEAEVKDGYGYVDVSDSSVLQTPTDLTTITGNKYITVLAIKLGALKRGTKYSFKCTVTDQNDKSNVASKEIYIYNGVTSCSITNPETYTELSQVTIQVSKCFSDADGLPLTYALFKATDDSDTSVPVSSSQGNGKFILKQAPKAESSGKTTFAIKVCAQRGGCSIYKTGQIIVTAITAAQLAAKREEVVTNVQTLLKEGDTLSGCLQLAIYLDKANDVGANRRRRSAKLRRRLKRETVATTELTALQMELVQKALNDIDLDETVGNTLLGVLGVLPASGASDNDMRNITSFFIKIVTFFQTNNTKLIAASVQHVEKWIKSLEERSVSGREVTQLNDLMKKARRLGYRLYESQTFTMTESVRKFMVVIPGSHKAKDGSGTTIDFGQTLKSRFSQWSCSSGTCEGVGVEVTTSNTEVDPYSTNSNDIKLRATDIVDIVFVDPKSGEVIADLNSLTDPVTLTFDVTKPQDQANFLCKFWDTSKKEWDTEGVTTRSQATSVITCSSSHLTVFAAFAGSTTTYTSSGPDKTGLIVGVTIGVLIAMCIIVLIVVFATRGLQKKKRHRLITPEPAPIHD